MRTDAINVLQECLESEDLPDSEAHHVHRELSRMHASAGHLNLAELHLGESRRLTPPDAARRRHLTHAAELATTSGMLELAMSALVRLARVAETPEQRTYYMRRCEKLYPLLDVATPDAREYERLKDEGGH